MVTSNTDTSPSEQTAATPTSEGTPSERLSHREFGARLLRTGDLDPVYVMLARASTVLPPDQIQRWCVAYWCFYHAGLASQASQAGGQGFWDILKSDLFQSLRGVERRHFRGKQAMEALEDLERRYPQPEQMIEYVFQTLKFSEVAKRAQEHKLFGPWIAFKMADMGERVLGFKVDFSDCVLGIYEEPVRGAALIAYGDSSASITKDDLNLLIEQAAGYYNAQGFRAPPWNDRPINVQEIETILCKYKSHWNGHYPVGKDSREVAEALEHWGSTAKMLREYVPNE